jgi:hydrogenase expression/formation protein HypD
VLPGGGLALRGPYRRLDARERFGITPVESSATGTEDPCISGQILRGLAQPPDCPAFGGACTPEHPLGAPMVSSEGACAAYYRYRPPLACGAASIRP